MWQEHVKSSYRQNYNLGVKFNMKCIKIFSSNNMTSPDQIFTYSDVANNLVTRENYRFRGNFSNIS